MKLLLIALLAIGFNANAQTCTQDAYPILVTGYGLKGVYYSKLQLVAKLNKLSFQNCVRVNGEQVWPGFGPCLDLSGPSVFPLGQENGEEYLRILDLANSMQNCVQVKLISQDNLVRIETGEAKFGPCLTIVETTPGNFSN